MLNKLVKGRKQKFPGSYADLPEFSIHFRSIQPAGLSNSLNFPESPLKRGSARSPVLYTDLHHNPWDRVAGERVSARKADLTVRVRWLAAE